MLVDISALIFAATFTLIKVYLLKSFGPFLNVFKESDYQTKYL